MFAARLLAAEHGDAAAQRAVAIAYRWGDGGPADPREAVRRFRSAAAQGDAEAMAQLGSMTLNGAGAAQDDAVAVALFRQAAAL